MKKRLLMVCLILTFAVPVFAELTVEDAVSPEYLKNHGYSTPLINTTRKSIAQVNGEPLSEPLERNYYGIGFFKAVRRVFMYIDPSLDDHSFSNDHEIHMSPRFDEL